jgi:transcriptional regulator NrdR family protein
MKCPKCKAPTEVKETRINSEYVMRQRICFNMHKFRTEERAVSEPKDVRKTFVL